MATGALFARVKKWIGVEVIENKDLNAEFDNILNNFAMNKMSGWSVNPSQMKTQTSPGTFGSESLATSLSGEVERLRYVIAKIIDGPNGLWYDTPSINLAQIYNVLAPNLIPPNRIVSGRTRTSSKQATHLVPDGTLPKVTLKCSTTPFDCFINGVEYTFNADIVLSSLATAGATGNTATVNDSSLSGVFFAGQVGEIGSFVENDYPFTVDNIGSAIIGQPNKYIGLKITQSGVDEYMFMKVIQYETATTASFVQPTLFNFLTIDVQSTKNMFVDQNCTIAGGAYVVNAIPTPTTVEVTWNGGGPYSAGDTIPAGVAFDFQGIGEGYRGYFFDKNDAPIVRQTTLDNDTLTLMQLNWIYLTTAGTLFASTSQPTYSALQPASASTGDMWFDMVAQQWKQFNGATWAAANCIYVGIAICDSSACQGARSADAYYNYQEVNSIRPEKLTNTQIRAYGPASEVNILGSNFQFQRGFLVWDQATNMEAGQTLSSISYCYLYVSEAGIPWISNIAPYNRNYDLRGWYHPYQSWRCIGQVFLDSNTYFVEGADFLRNYGQIDGRKIAGRSISASHRMSAGNPGRSVGINGIAQSVSSGASVSNGGSLGFTGLQVEIECSGRPVLILIQPDGDMTSGNYGYMEGANYGTLLLYKNGVPYMQNAVGADGFGFTGNPFIAIDPVPGIGQIVYQIWWQSLSGTIYFQYLRLYAVEI